MLPLYTPWSEQFQNPWLRLIEGENSSTSQLLTNLNYHDLKQYGSLWGTTTSTRHFRDALLMRHPLWRDEHSDWQTAREELQREEGDRYSPETIKPLTPFGLLRRPGEYA